MLQTVTWIPWLWASLWSCDSPRFFRQQLRIGVYEIHRRREVRIGDFFTEGMGSSIDFLWTLPWWTNGPLICQRVSTFFVNLPWPLSFPIIVSSFPRKNYLQFLTVNGRKRDMETIWPHQGWMLDKKKSDRVWNRRSWEALVRCSHGPMYSEEA